MPPQGSLRTASVLVSVLVAGLAGCDFRDDPGSGAPPPCTIALSASHPPNGDTHLDSFVTGASTMTVQGVPHTRVRAERIVGIVRHGIEVVFEDATGDVKSVQVVWADFTPGTPHPGASVSCSDASVPCGAGVHVDRVGRQVVLSGLVLAGGGVTTTLDGTICY